MEWKLINLKDEFEYIFQLNQHLKTEIINMFIYDIILKNLKFTLNVRTHYHT